MATIHLAYLFNIDAFKLTMDPIVERLQLKHFDTLYQTARQTAATNPGVWAILEDHRFYEDALDNAGVLADFDEYTNFWMMIIIAAFLRPVQTPFGYVRLVSEALRKVGETEEVIDKVTIGRPLCSLLLPHLTSGSDQRQSNHLPMWCRYIGRWPGMTGWLDKSDIWDLLHKLSPLHEILEKGTQQRTTISDDELKVYESARQMLSIADQAGQGLFLAIAD